MFVSNGRPKCACVTQVIGLMQNFNRASESGNGHGVNLMSLDPATAKWTVRKLTNMGRPNWDV
jgi:hypothetical protein